MKIHHLGFKASLAGLTLLFAFIFFGINATPATASTDIVIYGANIKVPDSPSHDPYYGGIYSLPTKYTGKAGETIAADSITLSNIVSIFTSNLILFYNSLGNNFISASKYAQLLNATLQDNSAIYKNSMANLQGVTLPANFTATAGELLVHKYATIVTDDPEYYVILPAVDQKNQTTNIVIQDTAGKTLETRTVTGVPGSTYEYVLDSSLPSGSKFVTASGHTIAFDSNFSKLSATIQNFSVNITDNMPANSVYVAIPADETGAIIHYRYADGTTAAPNKVLHGTAGSQQSATSPTITGYTADKATVAMTMGQDTETTVTYQRSKVSSTIHYQYANGKQAAPDKTVTGLPDTTTNVTSPTIKGYTPDKATVTVKFGDTTDTTVTYQQDKVSSTIHYQYANGKQAAPDKTVTGLPDTSTDVTSPTIKSYTPDKATVTVKFGSVTETTVSYHQDPVIPSTTSSANTGSTNSTSGNANSTATTPSSEKTVALMVYVKKTIYRYSSPTFTKAARLKNYPQRPRITAQTFRVVGTATSKTGKLRYKLADGSYITANSAFVGNLYWQGTRYRKLKVINPAGTYLYRRTNFAHKNRGKLLKRNATVKVVKVVHRGLMTRYQLANGQYVTGNKQWVTPIR